MPYTQKRIDNGIKRAALYARVSTEEQAMHGVSLDAQRERLIQYARENDLTITGIYVDEGISARKRYTARPEFMKMLESVKAREVDVVLFIKLDRWFRNIADYYEVQAILDRYRVQWVATEEDYDTTTANGRLALNIKLAIAQDESDRTSERIKFVFQNMVKEGRVISGSAPIGLRVEDKHIVIDEERTEIAKDVFKHFIDTRSTKAVQRYIKDRYDLLIDLKTIKRMLQNPWYIGEAYGIENWCPATVDRETFRLANEILDVRAERFDTSRTDRVYLFTGLLFCAHCGRRMTTYSCANTRKDGSKMRFIYYRCPGYMQGVCTMNKQINQDKLEDWAVKNLRMKAENLNFGLEQTKNALPKKTADPSKILAKIEKLKDLYLSDLLPKEIYERDYTALAAQLDEIRKQEFKRELKPINLRALDDALGIYQKLDLPARKAFWSRTIKRIVASKDSDFEIDFNQL